MSRAMELNSFHLLSCALVLTLFLFQKGQDFFPTLPIAALLPRSRRGADLPLAGWESFLQIDGLDASSNEGFCFPTAGGRQA